MTGICGKRLRLRALELADREVFRQFVNDPEVMGGSNSFRPVSQSAQEKWFESAALSSSDSWFAIETLEESAVAVGTCCLVDWDPVVRQAELRIRIGDRQYWGKGLGREACELLIEHGFSDLNLERIWLRVFSNNERAANLYQSLGFALEGRLRRAAYLQGAWQDVLLMGLLKDSIDESKQDKK